MSQSPAERLAQRLRTTRPMPTITVPREHEPALPISQTPKRAANRPHHINTTMTAEAHSMLEKLTHHFRQQYGRSWRINNTLESALLALTNQLESEKSSNK